MRVDSPAFGGALSLVKESIYGDSDATGQPPNSGYGRGKVTKTIQSTLAGSSLSANLAPMLMLYDEAGRLVRTVLDVNVNNFDDSTGTDRVNDTLETIESFDSAIWSVKTESFYPYSGANAGTAVQTTKTATRLTGFTGNVRGEVHGDAQVEWVRQGEHYQVHLEVTVGLPIAPLVTRRMSSDGELTEQGLFPRRYDEDTKLMFRERRRVTMLFEPEAIVMPDGQRLRRWAGVQDTASQFVQLSWLFSTRPELLRTGNTIDFALALPKNVDRWVYDVLGEEPVATHFGAVDAFHLKPRRVSRPGGDLVAEIWFAPTLRYLPARIRIEQDADTFIDLVLSRKPELAQQ